MKINSCEIKGNSGKHFQTIGEVAKSLGLEPHVLRFWEEKFVQIKTIKRCGRRLYDEDSVNLIRKIKYLLYEKGYTIKGAQSELYKCIVGESYNVSSDYRKSLEDLLAEIISLRNYLTSKCNGT